MRQRARESTQWIAGREASEREREFLARYFGDSLDCGRLRIVASLGRRSWSPFGSRISLVRGHFVDADAKREVELSDPLSAAVFAHEAMHVWQRQGGRRVTWEAIPLQVGYWAGRDPYAYEACEDAEGMLEQFKAANVERQAKIVEDFVYRDLRGGDVGVFELVARHIRSR